MIAYPHAFEGEVTRHELGRYAYTVLRLPPGIAASLPFDAHPRLRVEGEIADHAFEAAWQPDGAGGRYLIVPRALLKEAGLSVGDEVECRFRIADQAAVDVPPALAGALAEDDTLREQWDALTPGLRRAFAHRVATAKRETTVAKRVEEVTAMVRKGQRYGKGGKVVG